MQTEPGDASRQRVLVVPHEALGELYARPCFYHDDSSVLTVVRTIHQRGSWVDREQAEDDDALAQVIACAVVRCREEIFCVRRSAKSGRENLRLSYTMMIGGHVDDLDSNADYPPESCVRRELREELGIEIAHEPPLLGLAVDPLSRSGWLHLGLVFDAPIETDLIELHRKLDTEEFTGNGRRQSIPMMGSRQIRALHDKLDPWSRLYAESDAFDQRMGTRKRPGEQHQLFFRFISGISRA